MCASIKENKEYELIEMKGKKYAKHAPRESVEYIDAVREFADESKNPISLVHMHDMNIS